MAGFREDVVWSWSRSGSPALTAHMTEEQKLRKRRRAFCLTRIKSRNSPAGHEPREPVLYNNIPFMIHGWLGREIKHICSNCQGAEPTEGEGTRFNAGGSGWESGTPVVLIHYCHLSVTAPSLLLVTFIEVKVGFSSASLRSPQSNSM